jgi:hypothetical protein
LAVKILQSKEYWNCIPTGGFFVRELRTLAIHRAGNHYLMDEEFTRRIIIPPGIISSG